MNFNQTRTAVYYLMLVDGTVVSSRWDKRPGERHLKPGTDRQLTIKYSLTKDQYQQVLANKTDLLARFEVEKAKFVRQGHGWDQNKKMQVIKEMYLPVKDEPLMPETFFATMLYFV